MVLCGGWIEWSQAKRREIGLEVGKMDRPSLLLKYSWRGRWGSGRRVEGSHEGRGWGVFKNPLAEEQKRQWLCFLAWKNQWLQRLALLLFMGWGDNVSVLNLLSLQCSVEQWEQMSGRIRNPGWGWWVMQISEVTSWGWHRYPDALRKRACQLSWSVQMSFNGKLNNFQAEM